MALNPLAPEFDLGYELEDFNSAALSSLAHMALCIKCKRLLNSSAVTLSVPNIDDLTYYVENNYLVVLLTDKMRIYAQNTWNLMFKRPVSTTHFPYFLRKLLRTLNCSWKVKTLLEKYNVEIPNSNSKCDKTGEECSICLEKFESEDEPFITPCNHAFHDECMNYWLHGSRSNTCPMCRKKIAVAPDGQLTSCPVKF